MTPIDAEVPRGGLRRLYKLATRSPKDPVPGAERPQTEALGRVEAHDLGSNNGGSWLFRHVELDAPAGSVVSVTQADGRGRIPLLLALAGRLRPNEGTVVVAGFDIRHHAGAVRRAVGLGEMHNVNDLDRSLLVLDLVKERLALARGAVRSRPPAAVLERVGLDVELTATIEDLSAAERLLFGASLALVDDSPVVALEAVDSAMPRHDSARVWKVLRALADQGTTVLAGCVEAGPAYAVDVVLSL
ncbi:MAG: hypothetical protein ACYDD6_04800 [Acidimicrobiales bacterium]